MKIKFNNIQKPILLLLLLSGLLIACSPVPVQRLGIDANNDGIVDNDSAIKIHLNYDPDNKDDNDGSKTTRDIHLQQDNFGYGTGGSGHDCCPTIMRMWLLYCRNLAWKNGWFESGKEQEQYDNATDILSDSTRLYLLNEYNNSTGYSGGNVTNSLDQVKWCTGNPGIETYVFNYGTFVYDPSLAFTCEEHLLYTWLFIMYLYDYIFFQAYYKLDYDYSHYEYMWAKYCTNYPYPPPAQIGSVTNYNAGDYPFDSVIVADNWTDFRYALLQWADYKNNEPPYNINVYAEENYFDKAAMLVTQTGSGLDSLHFVLLTGIEAEWDQGDTADFDHAGITYFIQDPSESSSVDTGWVDSVMEDNVNIDDSGHNKLLAYRYICIFLGDKNLGWAQRGIRGPAQIDTIDFNAKTEYYVQKERERRARLIMPIIQYLLEED